MRLSRMVLAAAAGVALSSCASVHNTPVQAEQPCEEAWSHVRALLGAGLDSYLEGMRRYAAARDPELSMSGTAERTRGRAKAWETAHAPGFAGECRAFSGERLSCLRRAVAAADLGECGLEPLVRSFTDEVLTPFATRPFDG